VLLGVGSASGRPVAGTTLRLSTVLSVVTLPVLIALFRAFDCMKKARSS
jgi:hypothetical protein